MTPLSADGPGRSDLRLWADALARLDRALGSLIPAAQALGVPAPSGSHWYELVRHKLVPQAHARPMLVVAVVGGTNIGKSVVFNQLAGEQASGVSPLAAGTRNPVCLVPPGFYDEPALEAIFAGFSLRRWQSDQDALVPSDEHLLFWREGVQVPPRLLLLDTPDIDSDAPVNWAKAEMIRESADVLIAVLTQQKYNDAAVKQFFRKAADADKAVIVLFNQCELDEDRAYWPQWLATFVSETGVRPELVYVMPYDRAAAGARQLPVFDVGSDGRSPLGAPGDLRAELASLHFDAIKIRTLRGALNEVLADDGARAYFETIRATSHCYQAAADALSATDMARVRWPSVPTGLLVDEIGRWWDERRPTWSRRVHGFYRSVGKGLAWPVRTAWKRIQGEPLDPLEAFRAQERLAVVQTVEKLLDELDRLAKLGNEILRPRLVALLAGEARANLMVRVEAAHAALPALDDDYRTFLRNELDTWKSDNPRAVWWLQSLDHVAAVARPAVTVTLAFSGGVLAGDVVHQAAVQAGHSAAQVAAEAAITGSVTAGGEALVTATGESIKQAAARLFQRLQDRYAAERAAWLATWLENELLVNLLADLRRGANLPHNAAFREAAAALDELRHYRISASTQ
ncbi:MAG TPA: GTPase [Pirellulales bacterium]|nr:GTPase [Pirellulales bacterium]